MARYKKVKGVFMLLLYFQKQLVTSSYSFLQPKLKQTISMLFVFFLPLTLFQSKLALAWIYTYQKDQFVVRECIVNVFWNITVFSVSGLILNQHSLMWAF